jgi:acetyl esterase/lipase
MSLRLEAISAILRLVNKPRLARMRAAQLPHARRVVERMAPRIMRAPRGAYFREEAGPPRLLWTGPQAAGRAILYLHGGGFVLCSPRTHRHLAAALAQAAGAPAAMAFYRLAPEHPHPAQVEDMLAAYRALLDRGLRVAVAGDSAGGGLAFALTPAARAAGLPDPAAVVGFSPWCDMTMASPTLQANAAADAMLPVGRMAEVVAMRMGGGDPADPLASPVFARFDSPPPPALIFASRREILAGDAEAMAAAWTAGGGAARVVWSDRAPHAWPLFVGWAGAADAAVAEAGAFLRAALSGGGEAA